jgi:putative membrane protein
MFNFILKILLFAVAGVGISYIVPDISLSSDYAVIATVGALFALVNVVIKPVLKILTVPFNILTLGLFSFVLNVALFWIVGELVDGFEIANLFAALIGSVVLVVFAWIIDILT